jgi:gluconate kinase
MIISGFPGIGKTYYATNFENAKDLDSTPFSKLDNGERNPEFPNNYINKLKEIKDDYDIIFVSSHKETRDALANANLDYIVIYPDLKLKGNKEAFMKRYRTREHHTDRESFLKLMEKNFEKFAEDLMMDKNAQRIINIDITKENLSDIIKNDI